MTALGGDTPKACARLVEQAKQAGVAAPPAKDDASRRGDDRSKGSRVKTAGR